MSNDLPPSPLTSPSGEEAALTNRHRSTEKELEESPVPSRLSSSQLKSVSVKRLSMRRSSLNKVKYSRAFDVTRFSGVPQPKHEVRIDLTSPTSPQGDGDQNAPHIDQEPPCDAKHCAPISDISTRNCAQKSCIPVLTVPSVPGDDSSVPEDDGIVPGGITLSQTVPDHASTPEMVPDCVDAPEIIPNHAEMIPNHADTPEMVPSRADTPEMVPNHADTPKMVPNDSGAVMFVPGCAISFQAGATSTDTGTITPSLSRSGQAAGRSGQAAGRRGGKLLTFSDAPSNAGVVDAVTPPLVRTHPLARIRSARVPVSDCTKVVGKEEESRPLRRKLCLSYSRKRGLEKNHRAPTPPPQRRKMSMCDETIEIVHRTPNVPASPHLQRKNKVPARNSPVCVSDRSADGMDSVSRKPSADGAVLEADSAPASDPSHTSASLCPRKVKVPARTPVSLLAEGDTSSTLLHANNAPSDPPLHQNSGTSAVTEPLPLPGEPVAAVGVVCSSQSVEIVSQGVEMEGASQSVEMEGISQSVEMEEISQSVEMEGISQSVEMEEISQSVEMEEGVEMEGTSEGVEMKCVAKDVTSSVPNALTGDRTALTDNCKQKCYPGSNMDPPLLSSSPHQSNSDNDRHCVVSSATSPRATSQSRGGGDCDEDRMISASVSHKRKGTLSLSKLSSNRMGRSNHRVSTTELHDKPGILRPPKPSDCDRKVITAAKLLSRKEALPRSGEVGKGCGAETLRNSAKSTPCVLRKPPQLFTDGRVSPADYTKIILSSFNSYFSQLAKAQSERLCRVPWGEPIKPNSRRREGGGVASSRHYSSRKTRSSCHVSDYSDLCLKLVPPSEFESRITSSSVLGKTQDPSNPTDSEMHDFSLDVLSGYVTEQDTDIGAAGSEFTAEQDDQCSSERLRIGGVQHQDMLRDGQELRGSSSQPFLSEDQDEECSPDRDEPVSGVWEGELDDVAGESSEAFLVGKDAVSNPSRSCERILISTQDDPMRADADLSLPFDRIVIATQDDGDPGYQDDGYIRSPAPILISTQDNSTAGNSRNRGVKDSFPGPGFSTPSPSPSVGDKSAQKGGSPWLSSRKPPLSTKKAKRKTPSRTPRLSSRKSACQGKGGQGGRGKGTAAGRLLRTNVSGNESESMEGAVPPESAGSSEGEGEEEEGVRNTFVSPLVRGPSSSKDPTTRSRDISTPASSGIPPTSRAVLSRGLRSAPAARVRGRYVKVRWG
jgi:hypothetical protein